MDERRSRPPSNDASKRRRRRRLTAERLEPRVLLSADLLAGFHDGGHGADDEGDRFRDPARDNLLLLTSNASTSEDSTPSERTALDLEALAALAVVDDARNDDARRELVFVDAGVDDAEALIASVVEASEDVSYEIIRLDAHSSGVAQVAAALADGGPVSAIHVLGHGDDGGFRLGSDWVDGDGLGELADEFRAWAPFLTGDADLLLYGCDLATGEAGLALLGDLAALTGADVAASEDPTGAAGLGGDWVLEARTGTIEAPLPFRPSGLAAFTALLAPTPAILHFTTAADVTGASGAAGGATAWSNQDVVSLIEPSLTYGATTDGTFNVDAFDIEDFRSEPRTRWTCRSVTCCWRSTRTGVSPARTATRCRRGPRTCSSSAPTCRATTARVCSSSCSIGSMRPTTALWVSRWWRRPRSSRARAP
jgi:hypothetical protein